MCSAWETHSLEIIATLFSGEGGGITAKILRILFVQIRIKVEYRFHFLNDQGVALFSNVNVGEFHAKPPKGGHSWGLRNIPRQKVGVYHFHYFELVFPVDVKSILKLKAN